MTEAQLLSWFQQHVRPILEKNAPDRLAAIESDAHRLEALTKKSDEVTVCFLGNSGVGKSTLLNALAANAKQILPAGGIGPLTAQATEVRFSEEPTFKVVYHPRGHLWRLAFALESKLVRDKKVQGKVESVPATAGDFASELTDDVRSEAEDIANEQAESEQGKSDSLDGFIKQARNIVCGNQFNDKSIAYLVDALRIACGYKTRWNQSIDSEDAQRVERIREILKKSSDNRTYERHQGQDRKEFLQDLKDHAAGFLSPLIERIQVGWPSELLKSGVVLVDLPGIGIAQDSYRDVTKEYVRDRARAVVVVVDRAGPTESTIDLLRTSGYWEKLVGAADDRDSDPCAMLIAVTRVDDVTNTQWLELTADLEDDQPRPKKRDVFAKLVDEFKPRMRAQIAEQLGKISVSSNEAVQAAREQARENILATLEVHPVSAPEMRRILLQEDGDSPFLKDVEETGVPALRSSLSALARRERETKRTQLDEVSARLSSTLLTELKLLDASWRQENRAAEEAEALAKALAEFLEPRKEEYRGRAAEFRGFLKETVDAKIVALVMEAREVAELEVNDYLESLQEAHWATLRAAVRHGGTFYGSRAINLPDDISAYFQEPMAAVWGQKLLRDIRKRTADLGADIEQMVAEVCDWARQHGGEAVNKKLLEAQQERVTALSNQMKAVGKEAVDELRQTVKNELTKTIRAPIKTACQKFVREGDDIGPGVKKRILSLFRQLAAEATTAAKVPAILILQENAKSVRAEINAEFKKGGDPLQDTADLIVEKHEARVRRSDSQKRGAILREIENALKAAPNAAAPLMGAAVE